MKAVVHCLQVLVESLAEAEMEEAVALAEYGHHLVVGMRLTADQVEENASEGAT